VVGAAVVGADVPPHDASASSVASPNPPSQHRRRPSTRTRSAVTSRTS